MGLSIHYSGSFKKDASLSSMIEEVKDISETYKWKYFIFEEEFSEDLFGKKSYNDKIYGICFSPPECEPVFFSFLSNGRMSGPPNLQFFGNSKDKEYQKYLYMLFTKTQFAGIETHKLIIHIFKYISEKYFTDFKMSDEGEYWETGDEKILENNFKKYNYLLDSFAFGLQHFPVNKGETFEAYFIRLMQKIQKGYNE